jgi:glutamate synthase domain-containing protein 2
LAERGDEVNEIIDKATSGKPGLRGLTEEDLASILDEMILVPSAVQESLDFKEEQESIAEIMIGEGREVKCPLLLTHSFFVDANHLAKINRSYRISLAYGASMAEIPINIGEGLISEEKKIAKKFHGDLILNWSPIRIGLDSKTLANGKAIVIDFTKQKHISMFTSEELMDLVQGQGGLIGGETLGPAQHLDIDSADDLKKHVELLREASEYKLPIIVKISSGAAFENTKTAIEAEADCVLIDTSINPFSTPASLGGSYGVSLLGAIPPAKKAFKALDAKKRGIKLAVSGGFRNGTDIVKALALGADAVGISESCAVAMGCNLCGECFGGKCEKGISTRDNRLRSNFNWKNQGKKLTNYLNALKKEIEILIDIMDIENVKDLENDHIMALTYDTASITGVKLIGYDRELPMWFH